MPRSVKGPPDQSSTTTGAVPNLLRQTWKNTLEEISWPGGWPSINDDICRESRDVSLSQVELLCAARFEMPIKRLVLRKKKKTGSEFAQKKRRSFLRVVTLVDANVRACQIRSIDGGINADIREIHHVIDPTLPSYTDFPTGPHKDMPSRRYLAHKVSGRNVRLITSTRNHCVWARHHEVPKVANRDCQFPLPTIRILLLLDRKRNVPISTREHKNIVPISHFSISVMTLTKPGVEGNLLCLQLDCCWHVIPVYG